MAGKKLNWGAIITGALAVTAVVAVGVFCLPDNAAQGIIKWISDGLGEVAHFALNNKTATLGIGAAAGAVVGGVVGNTCENVGDRIKHTNSGPARG